MRRPKIIWLVLLTIAIVAAVVWFFGGGKSIRWIGSNDLIIDIVVSDGETGRPIAGAQVAIEGGGFYEGASAEPYWRQFLTNPDGVVRVVCRNNTCIGSESAFRSTRTVYVPAWSIQVSASTYQRPPPIALNAEYADKVERINMGPDRIEVRVSLKKAFH